MASESDLMASELYGEGSPSEVDVATASASNPMAACDEFKEAAAVDPDDTTKRRGRSKVFFSVRKFQNEA